MEHKRKKLFPTTVLSNSIISEGVHYISIEKKIDFKAGQIIALAMNINDQPRLYSIASASNDEQLSILFDIKQDGELTPPLSKVKKRDIVYMSEAFGKFLCENTPAYWIATGTGIAPFISLAQSKSTESITLLHGARTIDQFFFQDVFEEKLGNNYKRFCTNEEGANVINGRLSHYLQNKDELPTNNKYYLCGNPQMVIDVREILIAKGVPFDHIVAEIYF